MSSYGEHLAACPPKKTQGVKALKAFPHYFAVPYREILQVCCSGRFPQYAPVQKRHSVFLSFCRALPAKCLPRKILKRDFFQAACRKKLWNAYHKNDFLYSPHLKSACSCSGQVGFFPKLISLAGDFSMQKGEYGRFAIFLLFLKRDLCEYAIFSLAKSREWSHIFFRWTRSSVGRAPGS